MGLWQEGALGAVTHGIILTVLPVAMGVDTAPCLCGVTAVVVEHRRKWGWKRAAGRGGATGGLGVSGLIQHGT